jgi:hypothetical protein
LKINKMIPSLYFAITLLVLSQVESTFGLSCTLGQAILPECAKMNLTAEMKCIVEQEKAADAIFNPIGYQIVCLGVGTGGQFTSYSSLGEICRQRYKQFSVGTVSRPRKTVPFVGFSGMSSLGEYMQTELKMNRNLPIFNLEKGKIAGTVKDLLELASIKISANTCGPGYVNFWSGFNTVTQVLNTGLTCGNWSTSSVSSQGYMSTFTAIVGTALNANCNTPLPYFCLAEVLSGFDTLYFPSDS